MRRECLAVGPRLNRGVALAGDQVSTSFALASSETVQVPERKQATLGVGVARLEEWIEEDLTGQERLPGLA